MQVLLANRGNPDFGQTPCRRLPGTPADTKVEIIDYADASAKCRAYIEDHELGGGNWTGGDIFDGQAIIAHVSYNGRVWPGKHGSWTPGTKPLWPSLETPPNNPAP
jgi:hypothetical protein